MTSITKTCATCKHFPNDEHCVGCKWDKGENTKWELEENPIVIERVVLDKIRTEISNIPLTDTDGKNGHWYREPQAIIDDVLQIIDHYKVESEG